MWKAKPVHCSFISHFLLAHMTTLSQNVTAVGGSSGADGGRGIGPSSNRCRA